ncbi:MAG: hypothetical protein DRN12_06370 [Thermoplasmata archaeon]|nr:MAG: hypothetical protein DRN12_06370 [Thermoplasmata archaeon]
MVSSLKIARWLNILICSQVPFGFCHVFATLNTLQELLYYLLANATVTLDVLLFDIKGLI